MPPCKHQCLMLESGLSLQVVAKNMRAALQAHLHSLSPGVGHHLQA